MSIDREIESKGPWLDNIHIIRGLFIALSGEVDFKNYFSIMKKKWPELYGETDARPRNIFWRLMALRLIIPESFQSSMDRKLEPNRKIIHRDLTEAGYDVDMKAISAAFIRNIAESRGMSIE